MNEARPFIPRDKPKFWVQYHIAGLSGLGFGLIGFGDVYLSQVWLYKVCTGLFMACWCVCFVSYFGYLHGCFTGRYKNLTENEWRSQVC